ncbi:MAG: glycerol-3-phosphate 1-O-acyltransferase PlsY [Nitratireductor sp.]|nr:glycerol-3-phosphate 1-O-acyltransferase PlsY [Nitratireductor sp.]MCB1457489.1 glycerol-3-phosphate 1-O-acyltransferase PlsY [Nitratireductor sp.]
MSELVALWNEPKLALLWMGFGYLLGSIPFGLILTRIAGLGDLRSIGSGNIGATNVLRTGNRALAATTLILDALKGTVAVLVASQAGAQFGLIAAFGAFAGHCFPIWLRFRGGKGVATYLGTLFPIAWKVGVLFIAFWLATAFVTRISSASALTACVISPLMMFVIDMPSAGIVFLVISLLCVWRHQDNIRRLLDGTEGKIGNKG